MITVEEVFDRKTDAQAEADKVQRRFDKTRCRADKDRVLAHLGRQVAETEAPIYAIAAAPVT